MNKIRKGDSIVVLTGKDKGRRGNVLEIQENNLVLVQGINMIKKHVKPNPAKGEQGGIIPQESPIQRSNVALFNAQTGRPDRVGFKMLEDGRKVRMFKSTQENVDI